MLIVSINPCNLLSKSSILALLPPHTICFTEWPFRALSEVVNNRQEKNRFLRPCHNARSASKFLGKVHKLAIAQFRSEIVHMSGFPMPQLLPSTTPTCSPNKSSPLPACAPLPGSTQGCIWSQNTKAEATWCLYALKLLNFKCPNSSAKAMTCMFKVKNVLN